MLSVIFSHNYKLTNLRCSTSSCAQLYRRQLNVQRSPTFKFIKLVLKKSLLWTIRNSKLHYLSSLTSTHGYWWKTSSDNIIISHWETKCHNIVTFIQTTSTIRHLYFSFSVHTWDKTLFKHLTDFLHLCHGIIIYTVHDFIIGLFRLMSSIMWFRSSRAK
jgi:hypothetical protein